jgi:capsular exopolysaccharide synthesis family protein
MIVAIAFVVGVFLSMVFFVIKALLDTTIRRVYEVEDIFNIPIIGKVPEIIGDKKEENKYSNITLNDNSSFILNEAYNDIRANMLWSREEKKCPVYVLASADTSEGRTINAYNIAKANSLAGKKVLLIDADMRNSKLREIVPNKDKNGLADYLAGKTGKPLVISNGDSLDILYASENHKNKSELLATQKWYDLIEEMKEKYDEIVIDMPPLRIYSDALCLARTDARYIVVIRERLTKFVRTKLIVKKLENLNADIFGIVYNGISTKSKDYTFRKYKEEKQGSEK